MPQGCSLVNHNFVRAMTAIIADQAARYAVIDVGTNSVKFHLAEHAADGTWRAVVDRAELTRLGEGQIRTARYPPRRWSAPDDAIAGMVDEARQNRARAIALVGTAGLRMAANRDDVIDDIRERAGFKVECHIGGGGGSARLSGGQGRAWTGPWLARRLRHRRRKHTVHLRRGDDRVLEQFSLNVGAVRYTERFRLDGVVEPDVVEQALKAIAERSRLYDGRPRPEALVGMGGTVTNITAVYHRLAVYDPDVVQGTILHRERDRSTNRAVPDTPRRSPAFDRRAPTETRRGHPGRMLRREDDDGKARSGVSDRERSRAATRPASRGFGV